MKETRFQYESEWSDSEIKKMKDCLRADLDDGEAEIGYLVRHMLSKVSRIMCVEGEKDGDVTRRRATKDSK